MRQFINSPVGWPRVKPTWIHHACKHWFITSMFVAIYLLMLGYAIDIVKTIYIQTGSLDIVGVVICVCAFIWYMRFIMLLTSEWFS